LLDRSARDRRLRVVNLSRNFGKEAALTAGIDHASGDFIVPMDIDRQDPPALIEPFMAHWREGYDIVYGVRTQRTWDTTAKQVSASGSTGVQFDVAGADSGECRRLPPSRPARVEVLRQLATSRHKPVSGQRPT
jgi:glycosyltransferase involved in cell wall biosynthesis